MPDIIVGGGFVTYPHEKCAACKKATIECPLIAVLAKYSIESYSGIEVFRCGAYDPNIDSPLHIETQAEKNLGEFEKQWNRLEEQLNA